MFSDIRSVTLSLVCPTKLLQGTSGVDVRRLGAWRPTISRPISRNKPPGGERHEFREERLLQLVTYSSETNPDVLEAGRSPPTTSSDQVAALPRGRVAASRASPAPRDPRGAGQRRPRRRADAGGGQTARLRPGQARCLPDCGPRRLPGRSAPPGRDGGFRRGVRGDAGCGVLDGISRSTVPPERRTIHRMVSAHRAAELDMARARPRGPRANAPRTRTRRGRCPRAPPVDAGADYHCVVSDIGDPAAAARWRTCSASTGTGLQDSWTAA